MGGITNEVLAERIEGISILIDEKFKTANRANEIGHQSLAENSTAILEQVKKTNGRVSSLENWKNKVIGALIMTNLIVLPVMFILISNWFNRR